jgi:two-component system, cell cycle sensor histidine kinase and response regulator CckA
MIMAMTFQQITTKLLSAKWWPFYLICGITLMSEVFTAIMNSINSLIWWGRIDLDLIIIGAIDSLAVPLFIAPAVIYLIRHSFNLEEMNRRLKVEVDERTKTESALREKEKLLRMITDNSRDIIWMVDLDTRFTFLSPAVEQLLGYTAEEYLVIPYRKILTPSSYDLLFSILAEELKIENRPEKDLFRLRTIETEQIRKDGKKIWVEMKVTFLRDKEGKAIGILGFSRDITEQKKAKEALKESEEQYRLLFENMDEVVYSFDSNLKVTSVSPSIEKHLGYRPEEFIGKSIYEQNIFPEAFMEKALSRLARYQQGDKMAPEEYEVVAKDGTIKFAEINGGPIIRDGSIIGFIAVGRDITERKLAEKAARETEEKYTTLADNIPDIIYSLDSQGKVMTISEKAILRYGYTLQDFMGESFWKFIVEEDRKMIFDALEEYLKNRIEFTRGLQLRMVAKDGTKHWFELSSHSLFDEQGNFIREDGVLRDITASKEAEAEKARLEDQLNQIQKLEAVGTLAGGLAHDFNNLLMGIQGYASLMLLEINESNPHYEKLKRIEAQVQSGTGLTRQLMGFARGGRYEIKTMDINEIVKKTSDMFGRTSKGITVHHRSEGDIWPVEVDQVQIEQVLLNLYVNAGQAMPGGGELYINIKNVVLDESYARTFSADPGKYVKLSVTDTGVGMDEKTKDRIFEPFFTTREMGRGTGLGLAMVYGIIKGHKGIINVYSEKGHGTTFNIYLPASEKILTEIEEPYSEVLRGQETILVVDDEEMILKVTEGLLRSLGYRVITASRGEQAIEICLSRKGEIDLLILDMVMPGMNGSETFDRIKDVDPDLKVILSSGYSLNGQATDILKKGCQGFIQKPFTVQELSQSIRKVLEG